MKVASVERRDKAGETMEYGYIRVSSLDQRVDRQIQDFKDREIHVDRFYIDRQSGKDFERPAYRCMIRKLKKGDVIYVSSIDRLGRNYDEILEQWRLITKKFKADIVVFDMTLLDTREKGEDLTGRFIADLTLQILSYVAETERRNIRRRQAEGIRAAKEKGIRFGNPGKPLPEGFEYYANLWKERRISISGASKKLSVSRSYFYKHAKSLMKTTGNNTAG